MAEVLRLFAERGQSQYGGEAVTQLEHALQAALLAECDGATPELIAAALLHDIGHLLHTLADDAPAHGIDDAHEAQAAAWLATRFPAAVAAPVALHVAAKRYLCAVDRSYEALLSEPSRHSLKLQGGPMTPNEVAAFESRPHFADAVRLRRWDDAAKVAGLATPTIEHFANYFDGTWDLAPPAKGQSCVP